MLRRILFAFLLILACAASAQAQSTTTSATITDQDGQAFVSGTYRIEFNPNGHVQPFVWNGAPLMPQVYAGTLDSTGSFSGISIPSTNFISPSGTLWKVTVCPASSSPCYSTNVALQGVSLNIGSQITPPPITVSASNYNQPTAYSDSEIAGPNVGFTYFNLTSQVNRTCTVSVPCTWVNGGGIGSVTNVSCVNANSCTVTNQTTTPVITVTNVGPGSQYLIPIFTLSGSQEVLGPSNISTDSTKNNLNAPGNVAIGGPSPWIDITAPPYNAVCDGSTDATTPIQNAVASAAAISGTVFSPPGKTCVIASRLVLDNLANVSVLGGFGARAGAGNTQSTWKFTGTCSTGACLSERTTTAINFYNIELLFSGATTGPMVDLSHSSINADSSLDGFHGVAFSGPGSTVGPIVLDQNTDFITFDAWTTFNNASVFVEGPVNNAALYSDSTVFDKVSFGNPGTATIENASIEWSFKHVYAPLGSGSSCVPFLLYVNSYTQESNLSIEHSTMDPGQTSPCTNAFNIVNVPSVPTQSTSTLGGLIFDNNLVLIDVGSTSGNILSLGNNQNLTANGNTLNQAQTVFVLGTGDYVNIGPNNYNGAVSFMSGTPAGGNAIDQNGIPHQYAPFLAVGTQSGITGTGACAAPSAKFGAWSGKATCPGTTGASTLVLTPAVAAPDGYNCSGSDITSGVALGQIGISTTTCTLEGTITANDVIGWTLTAAF
jgi:hypothetical protein